MKLLRSLKPLISGLRSYSMESFITPNPIPATFLRGGTSKGIFINRKYLPANVGDWDPIFRGIMGSPDPTGRQLNGMGGGISSLSKVMVVGESSQSTADVDYTFAQIGVRDGEIDYTGNCGNLSSMVGVFARDEGLVPAPTSNSTVTVRAYNTNTQKLIRTTFPVSPDGVAVLDRPEITTVGIIRGSAIIMEFLDPAGARTGRLFPTCSPIDALQLGNLTFDVSFIDATNPTIFVWMSRLDMERPMPPHDVEQLRQAGARKMGLDPKAQAQPKIAFICLPEGANEGGVDIEIKAYSMGEVHKAVPMTVAMALGVLANTKGTVAWNYLQRHADDSGISRLHREDGIVRIQHPSGFIDVGAEVGEDRFVKSAKVCLTGRRLMKGNVWW
ncbi:PrpF protein [Mucidula mucida]|nr:PrpF protein [Mucidula mucida]